ncbi:MAG: O-antigen ligase family protein [Deltaproteobacteria bacterium]|nr:O-antigen ligase family protein [Deltaproteobacteria bacterium]
MTTEGLPVGQPVTRRTGELLAFPMWVLGALALAAAGLGVSALLDARFVYLGAALVFMVMGGVIVFYRPYVGILVIMSTMLVSYPDALRGVGPFTVNNLLGAALITILAFELYRTHDFWFLREPEVRLLLIISGWLILISLLSDLYLPEKRLLPAVERRIEGRFMGTDDDSGRWIFELLSRIAFIIFFLNWVKEPRQLRWVLYLFAICIAMVVPTLGTDVAREEEFRVTSKVVGWASNLNRFAFMMNVGIALFLYLANVLRSLPLKALCLICALGSVQLVLMSASRSGFIGLGIVGLLLVLGPQVPKRWKIASALGGLAIGLIAFNFLIEDYHRERLLNLNPFADTSVVRLEGSNSTEIRVSTLANAMTIIAQYPLTGVGLANYRWLNALLSDSYKPPHNSYVWALAEGGIPAMVLYLTLFGFLYTRIQKLRPQYANHPTLPHLPEWLRIYLFLFLFFSIFADVWLEVHLYFLVAFTIVMSRWAEEAELRGRGLPGFVAGTPGARRAAARALYRRAT